MRHFLASLTLFPQIFCFAKSFWGALPYEPPRGPQKKTQYFFGVGLGGEQALSYFVKFLMIGAFLRGLSCHSTQASVA